MARILISDRVASACVERLEGEPELEVVYTPGLSPDDLHERIGAFDGLIVRSGTKVTRSVLERATRLKAVVRAGTGVDNIDLEAATAQGVLVMNTPGGNTVSAAEHAVGLMMALARNIPQAHASLAAGRWDRKQYQGTQLRDKALAVIGLGKIGSEVARCGRGLGMRVLGYDPFVSPETAARLKIELMELDDLLQVADILTLHLPLTEQTRHFFGADRIARCKPGFRLVHAARGGIVDEAALLEALESGHCGGAALDVFETEPPTDTRLVQHPRVIGTPHLGASTEEAQVNVGVAAAQQLTEFLQGGTIRNPVNSPTVDREILERYGPWLRLAERLGRMHAQLCQGHDTSGLRVELGGAELDDQARRLITLYTLRGFLQPSLASPVNEVNAFHYARERGLEVVEEHGTEAGGFQRLLTVERHHTEGRLRLAGTLFGPELRVVRVDEHLTDAIPSGHMIIVQNDDRPGIVGRVGTIFGDAGLNIANMTVGRDESGGAALSIFNLDREVGPDVMAELHAVPGILSVRHLQL